MHVKKREAGMKFLVEIILVLIMLEMVRRWIIKALELEEKNRRLQEKFHTAVLCHRTVVFIIHRTQIVASNKIVHI